MHLRNLLSKFREVSSTMLLYSLVSAVCLLASTVKMTPFYTYDDHSPSTIDVYVTVEEEQLKYPTKKGNSYPKYLLSGYRDNLRQHLDIETLMRQYLQSHLISKKQLQDNDYYSSQDYSLQKPSYLAEHEDNWAFGGVLSDDPGIGKPEEDENSLDVYNTKGRKM